MQGAEGVGAAGAGSPGAKGIADAENLGALAVKTDQAVIRGKPDIAVTWGQNGGEGFFWNAAFGTPTADGEIGEALLRLNRLKDIGKRDGGADDLKKQGTLH